MHTQNNSGSVFSNTASHNFRTHRYAQSIIKVADYCYRWSVVCLSVNKLSPQGRRDDMPPPMVVRLAADLRPTADGSAIRISLVADQLQAASVPRLRQTDGSRYRLMTPYGGRAQ